MSNATAAQERNELGAGRWWALAAMVLAGLVIGLDMTILITALPTLSTKLGATTTELQWVMDAYSLSLAGLMLPAGLLGDRFGRKRLLMSGLIIFGAGSLAASQMTTATGLIAMRALMGVGGAIILPLTLSILPSIFSEHERPRAVALAAVGAMLGLPLGPLVAGYLLTNFAWGTIFLINAPVVVLALAGIWRFVPESRDSSAPGIDWAGALLAAAGVTAVVFGIIQEPANGWGAAQVVAGFAAGAAFLAAFVARELTAEAPMVDLALFVDRRFAWASAAFVAVGFAMSGVMFTLSPYLQIVKGNDPQMTGILLLPMIGGVIAGAVAGERVASRVGGKVAVAGGLLVTGGGLLMMAQTSTTTVYLSIAIALSVLGVGMGLAMPTALDAILGALPPAQTGSGTALTRTLQNVAASFGVAVLGSMLANVYVGDLTGRLAGLPSSLAGAAQGSVAGAVAAAQHLPAALSRPLVSAADAGYVHGMTEVLVVCAILSAMVAVPVALFLPARAAQRGDRAAEADSSSRVAA